MKGIAAAAGVLVVGVAIYFTLAPSSTVSPKPAQPAEVSPGPAQPRAGEAATVARLEAELEDAKAQLAERKAEISKLQARIRRFEAKTPGGAEVPTPRAAKLVLADLRDLAKTQGLQAYATVGADTPLLQELKAMGAEGIKVLAKLLRTGNDTERFVAAALMEKLLDPAAIPALEGALFGDDQGNILVQRMASHALGKIGGEKAIPALERVLAEGSEWGIRTNAAHSLAQMGRESGIEWIGKAYASQKDATAKLTLLQVMADIGDPSFVPALHAVLEKETEYSKRLIAVMGISKASSESSLPVLKALIEAGADKMIIVEAKKAYNEIAGKPVYPPAE